MSMTSIIGTLGLLGFLQSAALYGSLPVRADEPTTIYWAGIVTQQIAAETPVVTIRRVMEDSPAQRSGLQAGDRIITVGEFAVTTHPEVVSAVQASRGELVRVVVRRAEATLKVLLHPLPRPLDYRERVLRDRQQEAEDQQAEDREPRQVEDRARGEIQENFIELLALAAKQASPASAQEKSDDPREIEAKKSGSTQLLLKKIEVTLEQIAEDWNALHARHQKLLQELLLQAEDR